MQSVSTFTKFLLGFIIIIVASLVITALVPADTHETVVEECGEEEVC